MTSRRGLLGVFALILMIAGATAVDGQQSPPPLEEQQLKVDVVLSRSQGEKKVSHVPYALWLVVTNVGRTSLRIGVDLQGDPSSTTSKEGVTTTRRESRFLGTSIDCSANPAGPGRYRLSLSIQDSSALPIQQGQVAFRTYSVSNYIIVRDGQTVTFSVGTDQVTGETLRAEVTLTVMK